MRSTRSCERSPPSAEVAGRKIIDSACELVRFVGRTGLGGDGRRYGSYMYQVPMGMIRE